MNTNEDYKAVYEKYLRFSIRIAKQIVKDEALAEDIAQEVFYHMYEICETVDLSDERKLRAFITVSTSNKAKDYLKKNHVKRELLPTEDDELGFEGATESLEDTILRKEDTKYRRSILQKLRKKNPMNYEILIKVKFLDLSPDDVAKEYGITRNNVNNRILRTKIWLQKELLLMQKD